MCEAVRVGGGRLRVRVSERLGVREELKLADGGLTTAETVAVLLTEGEQDWLALTVVLTLGPMLLLADGLRVRDVLQVGVSIPERLELVLQDGVMVVVRVDERLRLTSLLPVEDRERERLGEVEPVRLSPRVSLLLAEYDAEGPVGEGLQLEEALDDSLHELDPVLTPEGVSVADDDGDCVPVAVADPRRVGLAVGVGDMLRVGHDGDRDAVAVALSVPVSEYERVAVAEVLGLALALGLRVPGEPLRDLLLVWEGDRDLEVDPLRVREKVALAVPVVLRPLLMLIEALGVALGVAVPDWEVDVLTDPLRLGELLSERVEEREGREGEGDDEEDGVWLPELLQVAVRAPDFVSEADMVCVKVWEDEGRDREQLPVRLVEALRVDEGVGEGVRVLVTESSSDSDRLRVRDTDPEVVELQEGVPVAVIDQDAEGLPDAVGLVLAEPELEGLGLGDAGEAETDGVGDREADGLVGLPLQVPVGLNDGEREKDRDAEGGLADTLSVAVSLSDDVFVMLCDAVWDAEGV